MKEELFVLNNHTLILPPSHFILAFHASASGKLSLVGFRINVSNEPVERDACFARKVLKFS
jgi:hypothetical protein